MTVLHLRAAGTSLVLDARGAAAFIVHWGPDLGDSDIAADLFVPAVPPSSIDVPLRLSLLPSVLEGWTGRPAMDGAGFRLTEAKLQDQTIFVRSASTDGLQEVFTELGMSVQGVLRLRHRLVNRGDAELIIPGLDALLPIPAEASELLDFTGLWSHERQPQRAPLRHGVWSRESRHGRPGHDDAFLMIAGEPGFGFRRGRVWAAHLAWSGDKRIWAERSALGCNVLGAGELLAPGEIRLAPGESYETPWLIAAFSDAGLDGLSDRLHPWIRSTASLRLPRPVVLNTWEAVYFNHDLPTLRRLADAAAEAGVERFVLDDGWFTGRRDDKRALGDWYVDPAVWPDGLNPLISHVHERGMEFGLWVEPEMISPDSALAAAHPDWILGAPTSAASAFTAAASSAVASPGTDVSGIVGPTWRWQRVLDLDNPGAYAYLYERLTALLTEYPIAFLKWDHNRDLLTPGTAHRQTRALYRLLAELKQAFPHVEIESCASGGARIDLGILPLVDRFWTSDTNDPLDRQSIQRWTGILIPPEYLGGHLGAGTAHVTGRTSALGFRLATALFGSAGIEWNLTAASPTERADIAAWIAEHKRLRPLLHSGRVVRADTADLAQLLHGVIAQDHTHAVFALVTVGTPAAALPPPIRFPGLDPDRVYTVRPIGTPPRYLQDAPPPWLAAGSATLPGRFLTEAGLPSPLLTPEQALLLELTTS